MNKKILIIFAAIAAISIGLSVFFVISKKMGFQTNPAETKEAAKKNIVKLEQKGDVKKVVISGSNVNPSVIHLNPGQAVGFTNLTKKDIVLSISNSYFNAGVPIKANSTMYSPIFNIGGVFEFTDTKNASISGQIIVSGSTPTPAVTVNLGSIHDLKITPVLIKPTIVEITITESGFFPEDLKIKKDSLVSFLNKTNNKIEIEAIGDPKIVVPAIEGGKNVTAFPFSSTGVYIYQMKGDSSKKGKITVE